MSSAVGDAPLPARTWLRRGIRVVAVVLAGFGLLLGIEVLILHLQTDPLADVRNTRRIYRVITNGRVFDPAALWRSVGFQP